MDRSHLRGARRQAADMQRRVKLLQKHARPASPILFAMSRRSAARLVLRSFMSCASLPRFTSSYALWKTPSTCWSVSPRWALASASWYVMVELPERPVPTCLPESSSSSPAQHRLRELIKTYPRVGIAPRCTSHRCMLPGAHHARKASGIAAARSWKQTPACCAVPAPTVVVFLSPFCVLFFSGPAPFRPVGFRPPHPDSLRHPSV